MQKAPGKSRRQGISIFELTQRFPDEAAAEAWFERTRWNGQRHCPHCGNTETTETKNRKPMPYWCGGCRKYFSVRTGTPLQHSRLPLRKWVFGIYLYITHLKGVSSMKLHRDLNITQKSAWFMLHRLREAWGNTDIETMAGPVEADETYVGGKRKSMSNRKRKELRGIRSRVPVVGVKDRATKRVSAEAIRSADRLTVQFFIEERVAEGAMVYTDESKTYDGMPFHERESVKHSAGEYVRGDVHTNGIESFWSMFKRGYVGTYHWMSTKHLQRYLDEFAGRKNVRDQDTDQQMADIVAKMTGKQLTYTDLISE